MKNPKLFEFFSTSNKMSALDTSCFTIPEKESGAGERSLLKASRENSQLVASEIVNNLIENAFEVVTARSLQPTKIEKITSNVVGDILENINFREDETVLLNDEIKQIIKEMKYPPDKTVQGVGDQLRDKSNTKDKILPESPKRITLERKNRLTNLVRTSKQMLTKFMTNESENEVRLIKSEEIHEKLIRVVDLDGEAVSCSATEIYQMPHEATLDVVDLKTNHESEIEEVKNDSPEDSKTSRKEGGKKKWSFGAKIFKYLKKNKEGKKE